MIEVTMEDALREVLTDEELASVGEAAPGCNCAPKSQPARPDCPHCEGYGLLAYDKGSKTWGTARVGPREPTAHEAQLDVLATRLRDLEDLVPDDLREGGWDAAEVLRHFASEHVEHVAEFPGGSSPGGAEGAVPGPRRPVLGRGPTTKCESVEPGRAPEADAHRSEGHSAGERELAIRKDLDFLLLVCRESWPSDEIHQALGRLDTAPTWYVRVESDDGPGEHNEWLGEL